MKKYIIGIAFCLLGFNNSVSTAGTLELIYTTDDWNKGDTTQVTNYLLMFRPLAIKSFDNLLHIATLPNYYVIDKSTNEKTRHTRSSTGGVLPPVSIVNHLVARAYKNGMYLEAGYNAWVFQCNQYLVRITGGSVAPTFSRGKSTDSLPFVLEALPTLTFKGGVFLGNDYYYLCNDGLVKTNSHFFETGHYPLPAGLQLNDEGRRDHRASGFTDYFVGKLTYFDASRIWTCSQAGLTDTIMEKPIEHKVRIEYPAKYPVRLLAFNVYNNQWEVYGDNDDLPVKLAGPDNQYGYIVDRIFTLDNHAPWSTYFAVSKPDTDGTNSNVIFHYNSLSNTWSDITNIPTATLFPGRKVKIRDVFHLEKSKVAITFSVERFNLDTVAMRINAGFLLFDFETKEYELVNELSHIYSPHGVSAINAIAYFDNSIYIAYDEGSIYKYNTDFVSIEEKEEHPIFSNFINFTSNVYPNPATSSSNITLDISTPSQVKITLNDLLGNELQEIYDGFLDVCTFRKSFSTANLSRGVYYLKILIGNEVKVEKVIVH